MISIRGGHFRKSENCGLKFLFADLRTQFSTANIYGEKLKFTANPQSSRQCCLIRGKTAWKKWTLLFSGLEVNVRELMTFFFFFGGQRLVDGKIYLTFKNKKGHHEDKITLNNVV